MPAVMNAPVPATADKFGPVGIRPLARPLGELLIEMGVCTVEGLAEGLQAQHLENEKLGETLVRLKHCSEWDVTRALARQFGLAARENVDITEIQDELVEQLPIQYARANFVLPNRLDRARGILQVYAADPLRILDLDDLGSLYDADLDVTLMPRSNVLEMINRTYARRTKDVDLEKKDEEYEEEDEDILHASAEDAPIIRFVNSLIFNASKERASDIHIEPGDKEIIVRNRVDGVLHETKRAPKAHLPSIIARVKIMAGLNIAEKRLPQDGRFAIRTAGKDVDLRVSVLPTSHGERVVLRLLEKENRLLNLSEMGFSKERLTVIHQLIQLAHGIMLVTGPTGSGKTTTLYAALTHINSPDKNIITVEDPVEYQLLGVGQMQVNPKINLTFAAGLRSILRQDPDVIMIGEIRDRETAEIAIHASLTGHLVFSTLHTNDAASAATRLIDMGIEPFLVASSVVAVLAQRLLRRICPDCKRPYRASEEELSRLDLPPGAAVTLYRGAGCAACSQTGYRGRTGIFELMVLDDDIRRLIGGKADSTAIKQTAIAKGMVTLKQEGAERVIQGHTTLEEVMRITQQEIDVD